MLHAIQTQSRLLDAKIKRLSVRNHFTQTTAETVQTECRALQKELDQIYVEKMDAYEKYVSSDMSKEDFLAVKASQATREQTITGQLKIAESKLTSLTEQLKADARHVANSKPLIDYQEIDALDPDLLKKLVARIVIFPGEKIKIVWNFSDEMSELLKIDLSSDDSIAV